MGIFEPFRALGYITDGTPFSLQRRGLETFVTVSVGKAWQIYNCEKLSLMFVGPQLDKKITGLASMDDYTYAATGRHIAVFRRSLQVATWSAHSCKVILILSFGQHILSVDKKGLLLIWPAIIKDSIEITVPIGELQLRESFLPTCIMHPDTYLNKILIGSEEGTLQLWNINTKNMIYEFKGWGSPIFSCISSPALDVVAIGCGDGKIHVHNLKYDETIVTFTHTTRGPVTALSFRTDGQPYLAAGGSSGVISLWDLEKKKLQAVIKDAHDSTITSLHFLSNEPVLLSQGVDNSLKMWIFDTSDGEARLLRFRSGHSAPPTCIQYYGNGRHILSAGQDRAFRMFSTIQDQQSRELSQGHVTRRAKRLKLKVEDVKLTPVIAFAAAEIRERDWCNVVTCHMDDTAAYSWRLQNFVIGEHVFKPYPQDPSPVKACTISTCGNFAILGTEKGYIERFNLQSGLSRGCYADMSDESSRAHVGAIVGLASDSSNNSLLSGGYDGFIKVWDFKRCELKSVLTVGFPLLKITFNCGNGLLATAADDMCLRLYDVVALRLVRIFEGHADRITDFCFSEDGKWLLSAAMDGTVRVWDLIASKPLDAMHVDAAVTSLSLSPSMDMLATSHVNHKGIYLWANQLIYGGLDKPELCGSGKVIVDIHMPAVTVKQECSQDPPKISKDFEGENTVVTVKGVATSQITPELVTLSLLPRMQWQGLVNLDVIKSRNKPVEPPQKPERAPFFLPTLPSVSGEVIFSSASDDMVKRSTSKLQKKSISEGNHFELALKSKFIGILYKCSNEGDYTEFLEFAKSMSPSALDAELRILQIVDADELAEDVRSPQIEDIKLLMEFFLQGIASNNNFEFLQAFLQIFLKIHGEALSRLPSLKEKAKVLWSRHNSTWRRLDGMFQNIRCMVSFLSNTQF